MEGLFLHSSQKYIEDFLEIRFDVMCAWVVCDTFRNRKQFDEKGHDFIFRPLFWRVSDETLTYVLSFKLE